MRVANGIFSKICLKALEILFFNMWSPINRKTGGIKGKGELNFLVGRTSGRGVGIFYILGMCP